MYQSIHLFVLYLHSRIPYSFLLRMQDPELFLKMQNVQLQTTLDFMWTKMKVNICYYRTDPRKSRTQKLICLKSDVTLIFLFAISNYCYGIQENGLVSSTPIQPKEKLPSDSDEPRPSAPDRLPAHISFHGPAAEDSPLGRDPLRPPVVPSSDRGMANHRFSFSPPALDVPHTRLIFNKMSELPRYVRDICMTHANQHSLSHEATSSALSLSGKPRVTETNFVSDTDSDYVLIEKGNAGSNKDANLVMDAYRNMQQEDNAIVGHDPGKKLF